VASEMLRLSAGMASIGITAVVAERLPTAFHEAGHAIVAIHIAESGVAADNGCQASFVGEKPMLRYCTITPRITAKGQHYLGETKLTVRWRDMASHLHWASAASSTTEAPAPSAATAVTGSGVGALSSSARCEASRTPTLACVALSEALQPAALTSLARITYLFGGHIAEQRLYSAPWWWNPLSPAACALGCPTEERVARLVSRPASATGDLRKAQQVARAALPADAPANSAPPCFEPAFAFADAILEWRWAAVCALSGALMVCGTVDGAQHLELMARHRRALDEDGGSDGRGTGACSSASGDDVPRAAGSGLLTLAATYPFTFGMLWGLLECPSRNPALAPTHFGQQ